MEYQKDSFHNEHIQKYIGRWLTTTRDMSQKIGRSRIEIQVNELIPRFQYAPLRTIVREASLNCSITTLLGNAKDIITGMYLEQKTLQR